jgi:hypothetical protein
MRRGGVDVANAVELAMVDRARASRRHLYYVHEPSIPQDFIG